MTQQTVELPVSRVADPLPGGKSTDVLVRLWDEAERVIATRRPPSPAPHQAEPTEKSLSVRYAYD